MFYRNNLKYRIATDYHGETLIKKKIFFETKKYLGMGG